MGKRRYGLKPQNLELEYSAKQVQELMRCAQDPIYFIKNYVYIKHPVRGKILFNMYPYQEDVVNMYLNNRFCILLSARQTGKSETSCAFLLWEAIFHREKTILIASNKSANAMELISKIKFAYEELPDWLKPGVSEDTWNKQTIEFENKSKIVATTTSKDSGRGLAISRIYCDEFAFVQSHVQEEFWDSILPTISTGGSMIISSTPNGDINKFAQLWKGATLGTNEFKDAKMHIPWDAPPGRDDAFRKKMEGLLGTRKWKQEYECAFLTEEATLIDDLVLKNIETNLEQNPPEEISLLGFKLLKKLNRGSKYVVGLDPSEGTGNDNAAIQVWEFPSMEQVFEYTNNTMSPQVIYTQLKNVLNLFQKVSDEVYFSIESNSVGLAVIALYETDESPPEAYFVSESGKNKLGFKTTAPAKLRACTKLKELVESYTWKINSLNLILEFKNFIRKDGAYAAQTGATDDRISAALVIIRAITELSESNPDFFNIVYNHQDYAEERDRVANESLENVDDEIYMYIAVG